ncbi:MAG: FAD-dependent oxidoreductase [Moraxellaceae bacterium]|nr:FAD-dependent oxidoreductase [Moraxellaceae bacterium]MDZ4386395.1 FAD-dependent oxidoreductase [Moraxellaceae bacterium]
MMAPVVILGTGLAGYTLARELRKLDAERPLLLISQDDGRSYSKPMLSNALSKGKTADALAMATPEAMAEQLNATVRAGTTVGAIDAAAKTISVDGETIAYSDLVLAIGADVFRPPLAGDGCDQVYSVNDLEDYARFRTVLGEDKQRKVLIIGGGLIGCEFANDLAASGYPVALVEPMGRPLPTLLPERASSAVAEGLASLGVQFHFGASVTAVNKADKGVVVTLADGSEVQADIVLSAIGLRPRTGLAQAAGLDVARGIVTNRLLQTSNANIYALGDCAEVEGKVLMYVLPLMAAARALAKTLAGTPTPVSYPAMPVQIKTPVCPVVVSPVTPQTAGAWQIEADGPNVKACFTSESGQLLGFALTGSFASNMQVKSELARALPPILM